MTTGEKIVTWGLLALIAWELWPTPPGQQCVSPTSITPDWVSQLASTLGA